MTEPLELTLALGDHTLAVVRLNGREEISELFRYVVDAVSPSAEPLDPEPMPGDEATLTFFRGDTILRRIHGLVDRVRRRVDRHGDAPVYRLRLVPRLYRASLVETQQIFIDVSVVDIIEQKLELIGLNERALDTVHFHSDRQREFVVQYRETDLQLIRRLAENLGISFFFDHREGDDGEVMDMVVFADDADGFGVEAQAPTIELSDRVDEPNRIHSLSRRSTLVPASYVVHDYNYRRPDLSVLGQAQMHGGYGGGVIEYGAHVKDEDEARELANIRAEELLCRQTVFFGESDIVNLAAGGTTVLQGRDDVADTPLLITSVRHRIEVAEGGGGLRYHNRFMAVGREHTFRPERRTKRPRIHGFVTAVVQGLPGADAARQSAQLDDEGRYTVQFHFDSVLGDPSQKASRPVRMAQPFGGTGHGMHFPLRPGTEVVVAFADGDPDRPIILGAVPNAHTRTPVTVQNATQNRITTASGAIFEISERQ